MAKIIFNKEFFNIFDTLSCGQVFRFKAMPLGFKVFSTNKMAKLYYSNDQVIVECEDSDLDYFYNYFDLDRDYQEIFESAKKENIEILEKASTYSKGIRILRQDIFECLVSFIISQNNNIKRISGSIEKLCENLGEQRESMGEKYYTFPSVKSLASASEDTYRSFGLGYRAEYVKRLAVAVEKGLDLASYSSLDTRQLKKKLTELYGVGDKVANCVILFGYGRTDSFPVDTWIEKVYKQDLMGKLTDREKISEQLINRFKKNSGIYQQYLFHYKRNIEKAIKNG